MLLRLDRQKTLRTGVIPATIFAMLQMTNMPMLTAAQSTNKEGIVSKITKYEVRPSYETRLRKYISDLVFSSIRAEGNIMAEAYFEITDTTTLWVIERWSSRQSLYRNQQTREAKELANQVKEALRSPVEVIDVIDLEPLPKTAYRKTPKSSDQPFTVMLFVDAKKGTQHEFTQLYHEAMPQFRSEPGVVTYQLSQVKADDTKFITYEKFRSDAAFQDHLKLPAVEPVIGYLRTSIKQPPFEKGLHKLIEFAPLYRD